MTRVWRVLAGGERGLSIAAISLMALLPCITMATRLAGVAGIPGSVVFVQQLTLCVAFLGAALAASGDRLLNASGSLGLLFPPSLPVILYAVYAKNVHIDALFVGGFVPGLLMVAMVSAFGVFHGMRSGAPRAKFC